MYYYDGNNRGSYDILIEESDGNVKFIAEVMNIEHVETILECLNK